VLLNFNFLFFFFETNFQSVKVNNENIHLSTKA